VHPVAVAAEIEKAFLNSAFSAEHIVITLAFYGLKDPSSEGSSQHSSVTIYESRFWTYVSPIHSELYFKT
jgi:hypothetical protein